MLENLKIKIHRWRVGREAPKFVNPYAKQLPTAGAPKISPYDTDYGTKKKKTFDEFLFGFLKKGEEQPMFLKPRSLVEVELDPIEELPSEPTFFSYMREIVEEDAIFVASHLPRIKPREKRGMSADEIARACEGLQW